jgi:hypothetical protein
MSGPARAVHGAALTGFTRTGQRPAPSELERLARRPDVSLDAVLAELAETDVMALDAGGEIRAAYPFSPVRTPIRVSWAGGPADDDKLLGTVVSSTACRVARQLNFVCGRCWRTPSR